MRRGMPSGDSAAYCRHTAELCGTPTSQHSAQTKYIQFCRQLRVNKAASSSLTATGQPTGQQWLCCIRSGSRPWPWHT